MKISRSILKNCFAFVFAIALCASVPNRLDASITAQITPSQVSRALLGTVVTWTVVASDTQPGVLWYRFRARPMGGNFHAMKDYSPSNTMEWTETDSEGLYVVEASIRNFDTGETVFASATYEMDSRLVNNQPVISPTNHPLVFLYSAPPCPVGREIQVYFWSMQGDVQTTPSTPCRQGLSRNFYLAGLHPQETYRVQHWITGHGRQTEGPILSLTAGAVPNSVAGRPLVSQSVLQTSPVPERDDILLEGPIAGTPVATDLNGNVIWYYPGNLTFLTRPEPNGLFFGIQNSGTDPSGSFLREFDLTGRTVLETNAAAVNQQLVALGKRTVGVFHHEARRLPDGNIATLATVERILNDVQGPGPVDVIGDMVVVLNSNLRVVWTWDAFDHLDVTRAAVLGETCTGSGSCMSHFLAPDGNDWTHGNALQETSDGNFLFSSRHQDWLIKIDYQNGFGDGHVLWRMGQDGDFVIESDDSYPWFSHQHDANFLNDNATLTLFDNGNTRKSADPTANSRGQALIVDENRRVVLLELNKDLGVFSAAVGSAQKLPNGNYHFDAGWVNNNSAISFEVDRLGNTIRAIQAGAPEYRTFRMRDLYTPN